MGVVSAVARQTDPDFPQIYIQTDTAINPGEFGRPAGERKWRSGGSEHIYLVASGGNEGLGFAIPSNVVSIAFRHCASTVTCTVRRSAYEFKRLRTMAAALNLPRKYGVVISDVQPGRDKLPFVPFYFLSLETGDKVH